MFRKLLLAVVIGLANFGALLAQENFVGSFAEPKDGGNIDTALSTFDGSTVTIVPRSHPNEAVGGATRWRNVLFAIRGVQGKTPAFLLPLTSPGSGRMILSGDLVSFQSIKLVWSYQPNAVKWNSFDRHLRTGTGASTWKVEARNDAVFEEDVVYISINEHFPVADFYEWLEADVFTDPLVTPTASEVTAGTFVIGYQSGAPASTAFSRPIPDMPLFGFIIKDPTATQTKLVMLVSGQHPYEGQNKVALHAAVDWILHSSSAEAKAYRANYTTIVYPFVNPTGELAGLWRGTAFAPTKDTNRNWHTTETIPSRNRGIDTVIVHKNAMKKDVAALGLGEPYAVFDYHQNFGDRVGKPDYVLRSSASNLSTAPVARRSVASDYAPYFSRISALTSVADIPSDPTGGETLRGYMVTRGTTLPLTFERSVYNTIASEWAFGMATVQALVDPSSVIAETEPATEPVESTDPVPVEEPVESSPVQPSEPAPSEGSTEEPAPSQPGAEPSLDDAVVLADDFSGIGTLNLRVPDTTGPVNARWAVEAGSLAVNGAGSVATNATARAFIESTHADVEIESVIHLGSDGTGIIFRSSDRLNYLRFTLTRSAWLFQKTIAGGTTTVASGKASYPLGGDYAVKISTSGPSIVLSVNGVVVKTVTETFNQAATRHGLLCSNTGARSWRSFFVRTHSPSLPLAQEEVPAAPADEAASEGGSGSMLLVDGFSGRGNLSMRTPDTVSPSGATWSVEAGSLSLADAGVVTTNNTARAVIESTASDVELESIVNLGADGTGLIFRSTDRSNYLRFTLTSTAWLFQRTVGGVTTTVASGRAIHPLKMDYSLRVAMSGPSIDLSINGAVVRTVTENFNLAATRHGMLTSNSGTRAWDSFSVRKL